jgi:hypothetical protein
LSGGLPHQILSIPVDGSEIQNLEEPKPPEHCSRRDLKEEQEEAASKLLSGSYEDKTSPPSSSTAAPSSSPSLSSH